MQVCGSHGSDRASPEREAIATSQGGWLAERPLCGIADRYTWLDQEDTRCSCWRRTKLIRRHDPDAELAFRLTFYLCEGRSTGPTSDAVTASVPLRPSLGPSPSSRIRPGLQQAVLEVTRR